MTTQPVFRRQHLAVICLCLFGLLFRTEAQAQSAAAVQVRVAPGSLQVAEGATVDVAIEVREVAELYAADLALTFDPDAVEVVDADATLDGVQVALGLFLDPGFVLRNAADNTEGKVNFTMTQLNPSEAKSGTGTLIVVRLRGKRAGASTLLEVSNAQLAQPDGISIPVAMANGQVTVVAEGTGAGSSTPLPSQGAGTPLPTSTSQSMLTSTPRPMAEATATPWPTPVDTNVPTVTLLPVSPTLTPAPLPTEAKQAPTATETATSEALPQPSATPSVTAVPAGITATVTPTPADAAPLIFSASEGQSEDLPIADSLPADGTLLTFGIVLLGLAVLLGIGVGAVLWRRHRRDHRGKL